MTEKKSGLDPKKVLKLTLTLFAIAAVAALALGLVNYVTEDVIAQQTEQENIEARQQVLPDAESFEEVKDIASVAKKADPDNADIVVEAYVGYKGDEIVGYTVKTNPKGYGGEIEILTGISVDGETTGITIISQSETAGLGARSTEPEWQAQFKGKDATKELSVVKTDPGDNEIQAITGATITSKAVTRGVNTSLKVYQQLAAGGVK